MNFGPVLRTSIKSRPSGGAKLSVKLTLLSVAVKPSELTGTSAPVAYRALTTSAKVWAFRKANATATATGRSMRGKKWEVLQSDFIILGSAPQVRLDATIHDKIARGRPISCARAQIAQPLPATALALRQSTIHI